MYICALLTTISFVNRQPINSKLWKKSLLLELETLEQLALT